MTPEPPACLTPELQRAVVCAVRRTDTLRPPPCYDAAYWREERQQIAACAVWQAAQAYDPAVGVACEWYAALCAQRAIYAEWRRLRADRCLVRLTVDPDTEEEWEVEDPDACAAVWLQAECAWVRRVLETLPPADRQLLEWRLNEGLTEREISARLSCSQPAVSRRWTRLLRRLRRLLGVEIASEETREGL